MGKQCLNCGKSFKNKMLSKEQTKNIVSKSREILGSNLKAIILFGSANNDDFIQDTSDYDFLFLFDKITDNVIKDVHKLMGGFKSKLSSEVDIKPFTVAEFKSGIVGKNSFNYFNGWGLYAIKNGYQKILFNSPELKFEFDVSTERLKKDALDRAVHYIKKLRRILCSEEYLLRGRIRKLTEKDILKITSSSCKNVLTFCLAYKGKFAYRTEDVLKQSKIAFGEVSDIDLIDDLLKAKKEGNYDEKIINRAYNETEKVYAMTIDS